MGQEKLLAAEQTLSGGNYAAGLKDLERIRADYIGCKCAKQAKQRLDQANKDPAVRAALDEVRAQLAYGSLVKLVRSAVDAPSNATPAAAGAADASVNDTAAAPDDSQVAGSLEVADIKKLSSRDQGRVFTDLSCLAKTYSSSPTGQKAAALVAELQGDAGFVKGLEDWRSQDEANKLLQKARAYRSANLTDKAIPLYQTVIKNYSGSEQAKAAIAELQQIKKS